MILRYVPQEQRHDMRLVAFRYLQNLLPFFEYWLAFFVSVWIRVFKQPTQLGFALLIPNLHAGPTYEAIGLQIF